MDADTWIVSGVLLADSPVSVAGGPPRAEADVTVFRDGLRRWVLPGTSLAGVLRHARVDADRAELWSSLWPTAEEGQAASRLSVDDAVSLHTPGGPDPAPPVRQSVAIDQATGAARPGALFDREVVPAGTRFALRLAVAGSGDGEDTARAVSALVAHLASGIRIGGGTSRGLGRIRLVESAVSRRDLTGAAAALSTLRSRVHVPGGGVPAELPAPPTPAPDVAVCIAVTWRPTLPVAVRRPVEDAVVDAAPLTSAVAGDGSRLALTLPGSSIKGVLRHAAERLAPALLGPQAQPATDALFGVVRGRVTRRSALVVEELVSGTTVDSAAWEALLRCPKDNKGELRSRLDVVNRDLVRQHGGRPEPPWVRRAVHVAVDRFTGGPKDGALFADLEVHRVRWPQMVLLVQTDRIPVDLEAEVRQLLDRVLTELEGGWLRFGAAGNRGGGTVAVDAIRWTAGPGCSPAWTSRSTAPEETR